MQWIFSNVDIARTRNYSSNNGGDTATDHATSKADSNEVLWNWWSMRYFSNFESVWGHFYWNNNLLVCIIESVLLVKLRSCMPFNVSFDETRNTLQGWNKELDRVEGFWWTVIGRSFLMIAIVINLNDE